jgi:hypothetical protein
MVKEKKKKDLNPKEGDDKDHPSIKELKTVLNQSKVEALKAQESASKINASLQSAIDNADVTLHLVPFYSPSDAEGVIDIWKETNRQATGIVTALGSIENSATLFSSTVSISSVSTSGVVSRIGPVYNSDSVFIDAYHYMNEINQRQVKKDRVMELMQKFHLDITHGNNKSPLENFCLAHQAFESPVFTDNPDITSLIPMRESIEASLDELLKQRPKQKNVGSSNRKKILAICDQLKNDLITDVVINEWADQWHEMSDKDLSASKQIRMTREEWSRKLIRATLFLESFLNGLDPVKLRK